MKKNRLLSMLLALVMLFGVASALGGSAMAADRLSVSLSNGVLSWNAVDNATYYDVMWTGDPNESKFGYIEDVKTTSINLQAAMDEEKNTPAGTYNIRVRAFRSSGIPIDTQTIKFSNYVPNVPFLESPKPRFIGTSIEWDAVEGATQYQYTVWPGQTPNTTYTSAFTKGDLTSNTNVDLSGWIEPDLYYHIEIEARSNTVKWSQRVSSEVVLGADLLNGYTTPIPLTGTATLSPSNPKAGDTLTVYLSGMVWTLPNSDLKYHWQVDSGSGRFLYMTEAQRTYFIIPTDTAPGTRYRAVITADGYAGSIYSEPVTVTVDPTTLSGTVTVSPSNPAPGDTLTSSLSGAVANISVRNLSYQWQQSADGAIFSNIRQATGRTYTVPSSAPDGRMYRLRVTADGYTGTLYSNTVTVGGSSYQKGDVNMDKTLDNADLILVARYVVNLYNFSSEAFKLGDMDNSGAIDNSDLIRLARILVGLS